MAELDQREMEKSRGDCTRTRKMCSKCKQMLSYSAYNHHLSPLVCRGLSTVVSTTGQRPPSDSTPQEVEIAEDFAEDEGGVHSDESSEDIDISSDDKEPGDEEEVEIIGANEECGYDTVCINDVHVSETVGENSMNPVQPNTSAIIQYICYNYSVIFSAVLQTL